MHKTANSTAFHNAALNAIPASLAKKYQVLPLQLIGNNLHLGMLDPTNIMAIDEIELATGFTICPVALDSEQLAAEVSSRYGPLQIIAGPTSAVQENQSVVPHLAMGDSDSLLTTDIINSLFEQAIEQHASDIHLEPTSEGGRIRFRIDGIIYIQASMAQQTFIAVVAALKAASGMDIGQRLVPQDGRMEISKFRKHYDIRLASLPTIRGEKLVLRILNRNTNAYSIESLGFSPKVLYSLHHFLKQSNGMLLVTGPTGCGKTTTLYAILQQLNSDEQNIVTIEDPVEYHVPGINQVQVNPKSGLTFADGLRAILRQDPNIIMVGEIRDLETAQIAIRSALTGHRVFSTLHTKDAISAIIRLQDMGIEPFLLASAINGVISQRLVRSVCPNCNQAKPLSDNEKVLFKQKHIASPELIIGKGCPFCRNTGYHGRIPIAETLTITTEIQRLIHNHGTEEEIRQRALKEGMVSLYDDGLSKVAHAQTTFSEVIRVTDQSGQWR